MGVYSKTLHHVNNKNFKKTRQRHLDEQKFLSLKIREQEILEHQEIQQIKKISSPLKSDWKSELLPEVKQEIQKEEVKVSVKVSEKLKSNWRKELAEGMTTGGQEIQFAPSDVPLDTIDAADSASFTVNNGGFDSDPPSDGLSGAEIVSSGTGSGNNGGFNLGRSYLSFNGVGFNDGSSPEFDNIRHVILSPVDATRATTLEITAIVGNGLNGGEAPGVNQDLQLWFTDINDPGAFTAAFDDNGNFINVVPYNGSGSLRTYSVTIPNNQYNQLRRSGISFVLFQNQGDNPTTTGDNYGITEIKLKRTTPVSVVAPLDSPEAVSFFRVGTGPNVETPEQRYRRITQQLLSSKNYTTTKFGSNYPGSNFSGISGVSASPIGKDAMRSAWSGGIGPDMSQLQNQKAGQINNKNSALQDKLAALEKENKRLSQSRNPADWDKAQFGTAPEISRLRAELSKSSSTSSTSKLTTSTTSNNAALQAKLAALEKENKRLSQSRNPADWNKAQFGTAPEISRLKAELSKSTSSSTTTSKTGSTQQPKPPTQQPKLDKFGRQIGTPLPPGVMQDMLKGGKTASPVGDAAIMAASALAARAGLNALKSGGAAPKPPTPAPKPPTPNQRVQNFNARMDAARNPNTGGYRDILKPQLGPNKPSGGKR
jgi:uncharacterized small protein (DUF1192 family)